MPGAVTVFVLPPDRKTLEWRLRNRGQNSQEDIERRMATARREIENYDKYDYILVNDRLEDSVEALKSIVLAERSRRSGCVTSANESKNQQIAEQCRLGNVRERVQPIIASFVTTSVPGGG
jgi:guanylate kinase